MNNILKLMRALGKCAKEELSIRQLAKEADVPYTTAYRTVKNNKDLFRIVQKGNINFCSLNLEDEIVKNYLIISERAASQGFLEKKPEFRMLVEELPKGDYAVVLFGSRAAGRQREKSDIDLCIINRDGKKNVRFSKLELLFKVDVNPIFFSKKEFAHMLKEEDDLVEEIMANHIVLYGENYFWGVIWSGIR